MNHNRSDRYCVIMCGGVGSRFWPFSTEAKPKQFLDFMGTGSTLLQLTVERISPSVPPENIFLVTNAAYVALIRAQLPGVPAANILAEPARRNTAPCVCWAARHIYARNPRALIVTLPSDHLILKQGAFESAMATGFDFVAGHDALLTLGIRPTCPETAYGYIQLGQPCTGDPRIYRVRCFTEKPSAEMARMLLASGDFMWNAGIFMWSARSILAAFAEYAPEVAEVFEDEAFGTDAEQAYIARAFPTSPNISVDYAVMEKARNVYVLPADLGWSDLGTWNALYEISPKTRSGNVVSHCRLVEHDCTGNVFALDGDKRVVAMGLKDFIVAEKGDALLIAPRTAEKQLRTLVNEARSLFKD